MSDTIKKIKNWEFHEKMSKDINYKNNFQKIIIYISIYINNENFVKNR